MTAVVYVVRLLSELTLLLAVALGGASLTTGGVVALAAAVGAAVVAAAIWGTWIGPRARHRLDDPMRLGVEVLLFAWGGAGFTASGRPVFGVALAVVGALAAVAMRLVGEPTLDVDSAPGSATR